MNETQANALKKIVEMLAPGFDWDEHYRAGGRGLTETMRESGITTNKPVEDVFRCGSYRPSGTPSCLYRALWLFGPKSVDFSDMYKCRLFWVVSPDDRFVAEFSLYKFELGLYFYCDKESLEDDDNAVIAGWPGADNGLRCTDPAGVLFFDAIKSMIEAEHDVYPGNDFVV